MQHRNFAFFLTAAFISAFMFLGCNTDSSNSTSTDTGTPNTTNSTAVTLDACAETCHKTVTPGIVEQWKLSKHAQNGVTCLSCHKWEDQAGTSDADKMSHNGFNITVIVSPADCAKCHKDAVDQFNASHHVKAAQFVDDDSDLVLSQSVEGFKGTFDVFSENNSPVAVSGCFQCHGTTVKVLSSGKLDPATYPNNGIGRINPDGSKGSCSACHGRHQFSVAQARRPDNCGKCHLGPDHPHMEIYEESSHGIMFNAFEDQMKLESDEWIPGKTYSSAPTCSTCHMGATATQKVTHDVSARVSWNLRATVSSKNTDSATKRTNMQNVCQSCHSTTFVSNFYSQLDAGVTLYNEKYAKPAKAIDDMLHSGTLDGTTTGITPILDSRKFNDEEEWAFWELWHHEGRRARAGMAMGGPDYTQWHGFYDTAKTLYRWFVPEACVAVNGTKGMGAADNNVKTQAQKIKDKINYYMGSSDFIYNNNDYMGIRCN